MKMEDSIEGMPPPPPLNLTSEEERKSEFFSNQRIKEEREEEAAKGGGGPITSLICSMATPLGLRIGEDKTEDDTRNGVSKEKEDEDVDDNGGEEGGGILNNIISNLFHHSEGEGMAQNKDEQAKKIEEGDEEKNQKLETEEGNGGTTGINIIENIVHHLPASIPDDAVPTADEATILINSLVRD